MSVPHTARAERAGGFDRRAFMLAAPAISLAMFNTPRVFTLSWKLAMPAVDSASSHTLYELLEPML